MHPLDQLLKEYYLTRNKFATVSGIRVNTVNNYVARNTPVDNLPGKVIYRLAKMLKITTDEVFEKLYAYEENKEKDGD